MIMVNYIATIANLAMVAANIFLSAGQKQMQALVDKDLMVNDSVKDIVENKKDLAI